MSQEKAGSEDVGTKLFKFDLYRSVVLSHYMKYWGQPMERVVSVREVDGAVIEVYRFSLINGTVRFATIGLFFQTLRQESAGVEYFFVLPDDMGGASADEVFNYILDLSAHSEVNFKSFGELSVIDESALCPLCWCAKGVFFDEPRGECESFETVESAMGVRPVFRWLVPVYQKECDFILENGISVFDDVCENSSWSLIDMKRPCLV